jgi:pyridoxamine 5'-phosphate oxidase family protein
MNEHTQSRRKERPELAQERDTLKFTGEESNFLLESRLGRIATVSSDGQPHVVPVGFEFDGKYIYFSGWNLDKSLKFRNLMQNSKVAFIVDDLVSVRPWRVRGIEIRGIAEAIQKEGYLYVKITPLRKVSWGFSK